MNAKDAARIAKPTIAEVLKRFLEDQRERLAAKTFANYKYVIELLQHSLDGYAYQALDKADAQRMALPWVSGVAGAYAGLRRAGF